MEGSGIIYVTLSSSICIVSIEVSLDELPSPILCSTCPDLGVPDQRCLGRMWQDAVPDIAEAGGYSLLIGRRIAAEITFEAMLPDDAATNPEPTR